MLAGAIVLAASIAVAQIGRRGGFGRSVAFATPADFDGGFQGISALLGTELPATVHARCFSAVGKFTTNLADCQNGEDHGTAVAEAAVDMAPGVTLFVADRAGAVHEIPTVGLRFFTLYGPRQDAKSPYSGVIALFADRLKLGEPVEIFGDGEQVRDFTYVGDAVGALDRALGAASTSAPVFNICTGKGTSVRALAESMAQLYRTDITAYYRPARSGEVRISVGDPRRAAEQLGFRAETALADGLAITLDLPRARFELEPRIVA